MKRPLLAEFIGTFWLVFGGCGSAIFAASHGYLGIGYLGVSLAFGLTVLTMAYTLGNISGCHLNPAVSIGLWVGKRFNYKDLASYIISQCLGAAVAAALLYYIATGQHGFAIGTGPGAFATNGFAELSPHGYSLMSCFLLEFILTFFFLLIIMASTDKKAPKGFAPIAIGFALTLIHLISIPITNTSVNPARSLGVALFFLPALKQVWLFFLAPILGGALGAKCYNYLIEK